MKKICSMLALSCALALCVTACDGPGEKFYNEAKALKEQADDAESPEESHELYLQSIEKLKQAIELEPGNPDYYEKLAATYKNTENYIDAIDVYKKSIELDPDESKNYYKLMGVYIRSGHLQEAQQLYDQALELDVIKRDPRAKLHMDEQLFVLQQAVKQKEAEAGAQSAEPNTEAGQ